MSNHNQYAPNPVNWIDPFGLCSKEDNQIGVVNGIVGTGYLIVTGVANTAVDIVAGIAGLVALGVSGGNLNTSTNVIASIQKYQVGPITDAGDLVGSKVAPYVQEYYVDNMDAFGDATLEATGSPLLATLANKSVEIGATLVGGKTLLSSVKSGALKSSVLYPNKVDWNNSFPDGLLVKDPRSFTNGLGMYNKLIAKGLEPDLALTISRELLESGVQEPTLLKLTSSDMLYKVVPKNSGLPGIDSPYFVTKEMLDSLPSNAHEAGSLLGLPQVPDSFDIYSVSAKFDVEVFQSEIAPFSVNGGEFLRAGGGQQTLILDRNQFTASKLFGD